MKYALSQLKANWKATATSLLALAFFLFGFTVVAIPIAVVADFLVVFDDKPLWKYFQEAPRRGKTLAAAIVVASTAAIFSHLVAIFICAVCLTELVKVAVYVPIKD